MEGRVYLAYSPRDVSVYCGGEAWQQAVDTAAPLAQKLRAHILSRKQEAAREDLEQRESLETWKPIPGDCTSSRASPNKATNWGPSITRLRIRGTSQLSSHSDSFAAGSLREKAPTSSSSPTTSA